MSLDEYTNEEKLKYGLAVSLFFTGIIAGFGRYDGLSMFCGLIIAGLLIAFTVE